MLRSLSIVVPTVALIACGGSGAGSTSTGGQSSPAAAVSASDSSAIATLLGRMQTDANAANWDAWQGEYTLDATRLPPNAPAVSGKAAMDAFNKTSPKFSGVVFTLTSVAGNADVAVTSGTYKAHIEAGKDAAGKPTPAMDDEGKFMQSLKKQSDGTWKITRDIWNSNLPAPGTVATSSKK